MVPGKCFNRLSARPLFSEFSICVHHPLTRTLSLPRRCLHRTSPNCRCCPLLHPTSKTCTNTFSGLHGTQFRLKSPPQLTTGQEFVPLVLPRLRRRHLYLRLKLRRSLQSTGSEYHKKFTIKDGSSGISNRRSLFPSA